nr:hypothetical protein [Tanacetum cinerariifolium]
MSSASCTVTYTSIYTDSEPGRPVALPSPDYIPVPKEPQTPPVPQDKYEREPMFIQPHDHDYVPEPIYPEYIPLEDEHVLSVKEWGRDEDEEDEEEEEEHLAPADFAVVIPTVELVFPPEGTEPVIPPPSTDTTTTGASINVRLQAAISLPLEAEVERLLAMHTPPPSPLTSLSPPSAGERLSASLTQRMRSNILIVFSWGSIIGPEGFLPYYSVVGGDHCLEFDTIVGHKVANSWNLLTYVLRSFPFTVRMTFKRTSTSAAPAVTQAAIRQLVATSVVAALEAHAANMENTDNTNRNLEPRETHAA